MNTQSVIAQALVDIGAVGFAVESPITFKSGIVSPIYIDNRTFPAHPTEWKLVVQGFSKLITDKKLKYDMIAGIETAGIPHSAALGLTLMKPSVFVRKTAKDHGTKKLVEGGSVVSKTVLLVEDHVSTGLSSLAGVAALRDSGAVVTDCLSITSFEMQEATEQFATANVELHTLTTITHIVQAAVTSKVISLSDATIIKEWLADPHGWFAKRSKKSGNL